MGPTSRAPPLPPALSPQRTTADQSSIRPRRAQPFPLGTNPHVLSAGHKPFLNGGKCGVNVLYPKTWLDKVRKTLVFAVISARPFVKYLHGLFINIGPCL